MTRDQRPKQLLRVTLTLVRFAAVLIVGLLPAESHSGSQAEPCSPIEQWFMFRPFDAEPHEGALNDYLSARWGYDWELRDELGVLRPLYDSEEARHMRYDGRGRTFDLRIARLPAFTAPWVLGLGFSVNMGESPVLWTTVASVRPRDSQSDSGAGAYDENPWADLELQHARAEMPSDLAHEVVEAWYRWMATAGQIMWGDQFAPLKARDPDDLSVLAVPHALADTGSYLISGTHWYESDMCVSIGFTERASDQTFLELVAALRELAFDPTSSARQDTVRTLSRELIRQSDE